MTPQKITPSRWNYLVSLLILVLGVELFFVITFMGVSGIPARLTQMEAPGTTLMTFNEPGKYTIFYEHRSALGGKIYNTDEDLSGLWLNVVSKETGAPLPLSQPSASTNYTVGNRSGFAVLEFNIERPGIYEVTAAYGRNVSEQQQQQVVLAIGRGVITAIALTVIGALASLLCSILVALAIAVVTFIKRRGAKKALPWGGYPAYPPAFSGH